MSIVIKAKDRFDELPEKEKQIIRERADALYAEITKDVTTSYCSPGLVAPKRRKTSKRSPK